MIDFVPHFYSGLQCFVVVSSLLLRLSRRPKNFKFPTDLTVGAIVALRILKHKGCIVADTQG